MRAHEFVDKNFIIDPGHTSYYDENDDQQDMVLVNVDVAGVDQLWSNDPGFYIGHGGDGSIKSRYSDFGKWLQQNNAPIIAPTMSIGKNGEVSFVNGRHRFAWFRDHGYATLPVSLDRGSRKNAMKLGLSK